jgi:hypothetical protein
MHQLHRFVLHHCDNRVVKQSQELAQRLTCLCPILDLLQLTLPFLYQLRVVEKCDHCRTNPIPEVLAVFCAANQVKECRLSLHLIRRLLHELLVQAVVKKECVKVRSRVGHERWEDGMVERVQTKCFIVTFEQSL